MGWVNSVYHISPYPHPFIYMAGPDCPVNHYHPIKIRARGKFYFAHTLEQILNFTPATTAKDQYFHLYMHLGMSLECFIHMLRTKSLGLSLVLLIILTNSISC